MRKIFTAGTRLAAAAVLAGGAPPVVAQTATDGRETLEEVVVTAERRAVSVQDIPISAIALSGEALENRGVNSFEQLQYAVPALTFADMGNNKFINIRGVGVSESAPNQTVGVAVHLDGAYVAREFVFGDGFFDLANIEVLRGPQGTYTGQNASGGAIFINSRRPVLGQADGFASVDIGNYDKRRVGAGSSFTLSDTVAIRIAGETERRDSFYKNHGPDLTTNPGVVEDQPGNLNRSIERVQLLFKPNERFESLLIHEMSDVRADGVPYKFFPTRGSNALPATGLRELNYDLDGHRNVSYNRTTGIIDWEVSNSFKFLANLSYLTSHQHFLTDTDYGSPVTNPTAAQSGYDLTINDHYTTSELSLVSTGNGPWEWTVGGSTLDYEQLNYLNFLGYNNPPAFTDTGLDVTRDTYFYLYLDNLRTNRAAFGELGYQLTPRLQIKAGLRYNSDEVGFDPKKSYQSAGTPPVGHRSHYFAPSGAPLPVQMQKFSATTGRVLLNFKPNEDNLLYATISRGYKPGGMTPFGDDYKSEFVTNYEGGWKGDLLGRRLTTSISAYYMKYEGFQRTYNPDSSAGNPGSPITSNIYGSTIKGIEAQIAGETGSFLWDASVAYSIGRYGDQLMTMPVGVIDGVNPTTATVFNVKGQPIDYLPELTWNIGLSYQGWKTSSGRIVPSARVSHQDKFYTTYFQYDYNLTPGKTLIDATLAYDSDRDWRVELYAQNLADKDYISRARGGRNARGEFLLGSPRQIGIKLNYRF